jgi:hyperosmotically inducible periplasmic protein
MRRFKGVAWLAPVLMSFVLVGACNRGPDPKNQVSDELKNASINDVNVDYDRHAKVVHLKGAVDSAAERSRAEEIARHAVGTSGTVANELTVKGVDSRSADDHDGDIRRVLNDKVDNDAVLKDRDINFDVNNGVVTIKGDVRTAAEKQKVGEMAPATENVKDVVNSLDIKNDRTANSQKK